MTPFGRKMRQIRQQRDLALKDLAVRLGVSSAYLSALERGHRGRPSRRFVHLVCQDLGIIWDEAEELQRLADLSHPKVTVDTSCLSSEATLFANLLSKEIQNLDEEAIEVLLQLLQSYIRS